VKSPKPRRCAKDRKIALYKQRGAEQKPRLDEKIAFHTAEKQGERYRWDTGNLGLHQGRFYARAGRIPGCKADSSPTVRAQ